MQLKQLKVEMPNFDSAWFVFDQSPGKPIKPITWQREHSDLSLTSPPPPFFSSSSDELLLAVIFLLLSPVASLQDEQMSWQTQTNHLCPHPTPSPRPFSRCSVGTLWKEMEKLVRIEMGSGAIFSPQKPILEFFVLNSGLGQLLRWVKRQLLCQQLVHLHLQLHQLDLLDLQRGRHFLHPHSRTDVKIGDSQLPGRRSLLKRRRTRCILDSLAFLPPSSHSPPTQHSHCLLSYSNSYSPSYSFTLGQYSYSVFIRGVFWPYLCFIPHPHAFTHPLPGLETKGIFNFMRYKHWEWESKNCSYCCSVTKKIGVMMSTLIYSVHCSPMMWDFPVLQGLKACVKVSACVMV